MDLTIKAIKEIEVMLLHLISIKEDLSLFYYTKHRISGMIDLAHSLNLLTDDQVINLYNRLSLI